MASPGRADDPPVKIVRELLQSEPFRFHFFQAVRLLERILPERAAVGGFAPPAQEVAHFQAHQTSAFPASEIQGLTLAENKPAQMTVNFMGLTGPQGVLSLYYTEYIQGRLRNRDRSLQEFFDLFNHRAISLFYRAWEKYRFGAVYERGERDALSQQLLAFIGLGTPGLEKRQQVSDESLIHYAGLLAQQPRSAAALRQILADYFEVPVEVEQFAGRWYKLDRDNQTWLQESGTFTEVLGFGTVLGDEIWDQQSLVRVRLGPLTLKQYLDFLPTGTAFQPLRSLVKFHFSDQLDFELQLVLRREETPGCQLGVEGQTAPRLGWVSWAKTRALGRDPGETILVL